MNRQTLLRLGGLGLLLAALVVVPLNATDACTDSQGVVVRAEALCSQIVCPAGTFCCPLNCTQSTCLPFGSAC